MLNVIGLVLTVLGLGITFWQYVHVGHKHQLEIDSLKKLCGVTTFLLGSLAIFLVVLLFAASRKTA